MRRSASKQVADSFATNGFESQPRLITTMGQQQLPLVEGIGRRAIALPAPDSTESADSQFTFEGEEQDEDTAADASDKRISKRAAGTNADGGDSTSRELKYEPLQFSDGDVQFTNSNGPPVSGSTGNSAGSGDGSAAGARANRRKQKGGRKQASEQDEQDIQEPMIDRMVRDIRQKVSNSRRFWTQLPYMLCNNEEVAEPPANDASCWNGTTVDR